MPMHNLKRQGTTIKAEPMNGNGPVKEPAGLPGRLCRGSHGSTAFRGDELTCLIPAVYKQLHNKRRGL